MELLYSKHYGEALFLQLRVLQELEYAIQMLSGVNISERTVHTLYDGENGTHCMTEHCKPILTPYPGHSEPVIDLMLEVLSPPQRPFAARHCKACWVGPCGQQALLWNYPVSAYTGSIVFLCRVTSEILDTLLCCLERE